MQQQRRFVIYLILPIFSMLVLLISPTDTKTLRAAPEANDAAIASTELSIDFSLVSIDESLQQDIYQFLAANSNRIPERTNNYIVTVHYEDEAGVQHLALVPEEVYQNHWSEPLSEADIIRLEIDGKGESNLEVDFFSLPDMSYLPQSNDFRFPWTSGVTWHKTQGFHFNNLGYSIDFAPYSANSDVLTIEAGTLLPVCYNSDPYQVMVKVVHSGGVQSGYLHLTKNTVPSTQFNEVIPRATVLGTAYSGNVFHNPHPACSTIPNLQYSTPCGCGTGTHLHFETNALISIQGHTLQSISNAPYNTPYISTNSGATPPTVSITSGPSGWINQNQASFSWSGGNGATAYRTRIVNVTNWSTWSSQTSRTFTNLSDATGLRFEVQSRNQAGQTSSVASRTFNVDTRAPANPTSVNPGCQASNNVWQNTCNNANFTWSGAHDHNGSGVKDYRVYWGTNPNGTPNQIVSSAAFNPPAVPDGSIYYLRLTTRDQLNNESSPTTLFILRYDSTAPQVALLLNDGAATTHQVNISTQIDAQDSASGPNQMRFSNNGTNWSSWQSYGPSAQWTIPALDQTQHTVYVQVADRAGNIGGASASIYLELYPPLPSSQNYRLCARTVNIAGGSASNSSYQLISSVGDVGHGTAANSLFNFSGGFLSGTGGCWEPINHEGQYQLLQSVIAAGGQLRHSPSYLAGDTIGETVSTGANRATSSSYQLSSGFWANNQITNQAPVPPTPMPTLTATPGPSPTPTQTPAPTVTPTPVPSGFGVSINNGALFTNEANVELSLVAPNVIEMQISNDGGFTGAVWDPYIANTSWILATYGSYVVPRTVYARFRDGSGTVFGNYTDDIIYDPVPPEGNVELYDNVLLLSAWDDNSGVGHMRYATSEVELLNAEWEEYETVIILDETWSEVYVQFQDRAGNVSATYHAETEGASSHTTFLPIVIR